MWCVRASTDTAASGSFGSRSLWQTAQRHRIAVLGRAVGAVSAFDAATAELVAVFVAAVGLGPTLHATATVGRAEGPHRRGRAFAVFVASVANVTLLIAAVRGRETIEISGADLQAVVGQGIASKAIAAIGGGGAGDAAVPGGLAARQAIHGAVGVGHALDALASGAARRRGANTRRPAGDRVIVIVVVVALRRFAARCAIAGRATAAARNERRASPPRAPVAAGHAARAPRLGIEFEAAIASRADAAEPHDGSERGRKPGSESRRSRSDHGSASSFWASPTAKPRG